MNTILVTGACGQLGTELVIQLREKHGKDCVIATDIREPRGVLAEGPFVLLDVMDSEKLKILIREKGINQIYHLAAILSANAEQRPLWAWDINMKGLLGILELCREENIRLFWPSSIAVFGPDSPKHLTPQSTLMNPNTVYGISKLAGERWCEYYYLHYGLDVRSIRYPGIISYRTPPGGGTTDYAVDIFHYASRKEHYPCFLEKDTELPMMYIDDAIRATIELMGASDSALRVRSSYNLSAMSFTPEKLFHSIANRVEGFSIDYSPDFRQAIANSWPGSIDDSYAKQDWGWKSNYNLEVMVDTMLEGLSNH